MDATTRRQGHKAIPPLIARHALPLSRRGCEGAGRAEATYGCAGVDLIRPRRTLQAIRLAAAGLKHAGRTRLALALPRKGIVAAGLARDTRRAIDQWLDWCFAWQ